MRLFRRRGRGDGPPSEFRVERISVGDWPDIAPEPSGSLRAVREARGLGLRTVAGMAGMDPAHLSRVERGMSSLSVDSLLRLAQALQLTELELQLRRYLPSTTTPEGS